MSSLFFIYFHKCLLSHLKKHCWSVAVANADFGVPQAALGVLLDIFYGLLALRQVLHLAASDGAHAVAPVELSEDLEESLDEKLQ